LEHKGKCFPFQCDVRKEEEIISILKSIKEKFPVLYMCVNNAGLANQTTSLLEGRTDLIMKFLLVRLKQPIKRFRREGVRGGRGFLQGGHFANKEERGFFRCGRPHYLVQKKSVLKFIVCPHGHGGGLSQCGQGGFSIFCGRLLWTAPNCRFGF